MVVKRPHREPIRRRASRIGVEMALFNEGKG
jgi:hypothetical protein